MRVIRPGSPPPANLPEGRRVPGGWDIATVVAEFDLADEDQATHVAELLFAVDDVLTVRVGRLGERSVYRVDVPRDTSRARELSVAPAMRAAKVLDVGLHVVRVNITPDGLGDPEGSPPPADVVPWAARRDGRTL